MIEQINFGPRNNSIKTKEELETNLKKYSNILSKSILEYLNSLLNCEISAIDSIISDEEKETLCNVYIYRAIVVYNIYNRVLKILNSNFDFKFESLDFGYLTTYINTEIEKEVIQIMSFKHLEDEKNIGNIILYLTKWSPEIREQLFDRLFKKHEQLSKEKCPYPYKNNLPSSPASQWIINHKRNIALLENMLAKIYKEKDLSDDQKRKMQIQQAYFDLILKDMRLNLDDFTDYSNSSIIIPTSYDEQIPNLMEKKLIKKLPGLTITANIKHL